MTDRLFHRLALLTLVALAFPVAAEEQFVTIVADPVSLRLSGPQASHTLLIHGQTADGRLLDLTHATRYRSLDPHVVAVSEAGVVRGLGDGTARVEVVAGGRALHVAVAVEGSAQPRRYHFENDIVPLLSRYGCNASGCHGKAEGQNGFKLSVFGSDPLADYAALTRESRGRRLVPAAPEASLLLAKASGRVPHGGGVRLPRGTPDYETIRGWIATGAPLGDPTAPRVVAVRVEPAERLLAPRSQQQLRVIARFSDGRQADVTAHARFQSNNEAQATVSAGGLVTAGDVPGEAAIMAAYHDAVSLFRAVVPRPGLATPFPNLPENNVIDRLVHARLRKLNILPSEQCDDADYLRRVFLDVIGTLPTTDEARRFLADTRPDKRARLVEELLKRPEYADYWSLKWSDLLRVDRQALGPGQAYGYYRWLRHALAANRPYDRMVRELLTAEGPLTEVGPASFYKVVSKPGEAASTLSQVFLGVRIACAECHHHPFDRWGQDDYYGMQAFFTPLAFRGDLLLVGPAAETRHPRTGAAVPAHALGAPTPAQSPEGDRRAVLAAWMTDRRNPWFARNLANRYWAHFVGRGLVEPVDDVRVTNPPTNPELLDALADAFIESGYDLRALIRLITASQTYQRSSRPNDTNERDEQNASRALLKRLDAEVLLDMISQATGVPEKFPGVPVGVRAVQLWDSKVSHDFLKLFGRPVRASACECERVREPSVGQVLHLLNSPRVQVKLSHEGGTVARLVRRHADDAALVEELYLTFLSRQPTTKESETARVHLRRHADRRREAAEDLAWGLLNSLEFVFNH